MDYVTLCITVILAPFAALAITGAILGALSLLTGGCAALTSAGLARLFGYLERRKDV
jgi:hypothetical protein